MGLYEVTYSVKTKYEIGDIVWYSKYDYKKGFVNAIGIIEEYKHNIYDEDDGLHLYCSIKEIFNLKKCKPPCWNCDKADSVLECDKCVVDSDFPCGVECSKLVNLWKICKENINEEEKENCTDTDLCRVDKRTGYRYRLDWESEGKRDWITEDSIIDVIQDWGIQWDDF